jgi:hypothetical protein
MNHGLSGTFTFGVAEAKSYVFKSTFSSRLRSQPCLFALPVKGVIEQYVTNMKETNIIWEHGYDGGFSGSLDIYLRNVPDGTMIYLPD